MPASNADRLKALNLSQYHGRWNVDFEIEGQTPVEMRLPFFDQLVQLLIPLASEVPESFIRFFEELANFVEGQDEMHRGSFDAEPVHEAFERFLPVFDGQDLGPWSAAIRALADILCANAESPAPKRALSYRRYWW